MAAQALGLYRAYGCTGRMGCTGTVAVQSKPLYGHSHCTVPLAAQSHAASPRRHSVGYTARMTCDTQTPQARLEGEAGVAPRRRSPRLDWHRDASLQMTMDICRYLLISVDLCRHLWASPREADAGGNFQVGHTRRCRYL